MTEDRNYSCNGQSRSITINPSTGAEEAPVAVSVDRVMAESLEDWFSTEDVAATFNVRPAVVLRMIREGRLRAVKFSWVWAIHRSWIPNSWPPPKV